MVHFQTTRGLGAVFTDTSIQPVKQLRSPRVFIGVGEDIHLTWPRCSPVFQLKHRCFEDFIPSPLLENKGAVPSFELTGDFGPARLMLCSKRFEETVLPYPLYLIQVELRREVVVVRKASQLCVVLTNNLGVAME